MPPTDLPDLNDPAFAPIRAKLTRAFLQHKVDLGVAYADDAAILERVDTITWLLLDRLGHAFLQRDARWLQQYSWFVNLTNDLLYDDGPDTKLDG
jgi:hypothetical protein